MIYVVLLRGVNVGGKNKISMTQLKVTLELLGCENVRTYMNSGNVLLTDERGPEELQTVIETALLEAYDLVTKVLAIPKPSLDQIASALPSEWRNDDTMRCEVMFLWEVASPKSVIEQIAIKPGIDHVKYVDGALLWSVARQQASKSALSKLIGTDIYKKMTIRNCNTVRRLVELTDQQ